MKEGIKLVMPDEALPKKPIVAVLYALPGNLKTTLSWTAEAPFYMDFDNGAHRAIQRYRPPGFEVNNYEALKDSVSGGLFRDMYSKGFRTACFDTAGTLLDNYIAGWLIGNDAKNGNNSGGLSLPGWGALNIEFDRLINQAREAGLHCIVVAHAKDSDGDLSLDMKGGSKNALYAACDLIGYIEVRGKSRYLNFNPVQTPKGTRIGKNTGNHPEYKLPDPGSEEFSGFMQRVFEATYERMSELTAAQAEALELTQAFKQDIAAAEDFARLDSLEESINGLSKSYQAQLHPLLYAEYGRLYSEAHFEGLEGAKAFTVAAMEIKANLEGKAKQSAAWKLLAAQAGEAGFAFDRETMKFTEKQPADEASA